MTPPDQARGAAGSWRAALRSPDIRHEGGHNGTWADAAVSLQTLAEAVRALEDAPGRQFKSSGVSRVVGGSLFGQPVIVKRFRPPSGWKRWIRGFRPSRPRRCWATSMTLRGLGIGCTNCLGFLEDASRGGLAIFAAEPEAVPARRWIKAWLHRQPDAFRAGFANDLAATFLALYRAGVYHADTKASNLLVQHPDDPARRRFLWIDLDCVRFGVTPSHRQVLRNLVQLNGSVGAKLDERDRLAFLDRIAGPFPWLQAPGIPERIRQWTRNRLERERSGQCGP